MKKKVHGRLSEVHGRFTIKDMVERPNLLKTELPFYLMRSGEVVAEVVEPGVDWYVCENCKKNTRNLEQFENDQGEWEELVLCDRCKEKILK